MIPPTAAERALFADLSELLQNMRGASCAAVETAIEQRFQGFVRAFAAGGSASLEITHTMTVHDDVEPWAVYRTEYRVLPAESLVAKVAAPVADAGFDNVIPFPQAFRSFRSAAESPETGSVRPANGSS